MTRRGTTLLTFDPTRPRAKTRIRGEQPPASQAREACPLELPDWVFKELYAVIGLRRDDAIEVLGLAAEEVYRLYSDPNYRGGRR